MWFFIVREEYRKVIFICKAFLCQGPLSHKFGRCLIGHVPCHTTLVQNLPCIGNNYAWSLFLNFFIVLRLIPQKEAVGNKNTITIKQMNNKGRKRTHTQKAVENGNTMKVPRHTGFM